MYASKTRKEKFSGSGENCQRNVTITSADICFPVRRVTVCLYLLIVSSFPNGVWWSSIPQELIICKIFGSVFLKTPETFAFHLDIN